MKKSDPFEQGLAAGEAGERPIRPALAHDVVDDRAPVGDDVERGVGNVVDPHARPRAVATELPCTGPTVGDRIAQLDDAQRDVVSELRTVVLRSERRDYTGADDTAQMDAADTVLESQLVERLTDGQVRPGEHRAALSRKCLDVLGNTEVVDAPFVSLAF